MVTTFDPPVEPVCGPTSSQPEELAVAVKLSGVPEAEMTVCWAVGTPASGL